MDATRLRPPLPIYQSTFRSDSANKRKISHWDEESDLLDGLHSSGRGNSKNDFAYDLPRYNNGQSSLDSVSGNFMRGSPNRSIRYSSPPCDDATYMQPLIRNFEFRNSFSSVPGLSLNAKLVASDEAGSSSSMKMTGESTFSRRQHIFHDSSCEIQSSALKYPRLTNTHMGRFSSVAIAGEETTYVPKEPDLSGYFLRGVGQGQLGSAHAQDPHTYQSGIGMSENISRCKTSANMFNYTTTSLPQSQESFNGDQYCSMTHVSTNLDGRSLLHHSTITQNLYPAGCWDYGNSQTPPFASKGPIGTEQRSEEITVYSSILRDPAVNISLLDQAPVKDCAAAPQNGQSSSTFDALGNVGIKMHVPWSSTNAQTSIFVGDGTPQKMEHYSQGITPGSISRDPVVSINSTLLGCGGLVLDFTPTPINNQNSGTSGALANERRNNGHEVGDPWILVDAHASKYINISSSIGTEQRSETNTMSANYPRDSVANMKITLEAQNNSDCELSGSNNLEFVDKDRFHDCSKIPIVSHALNRNRFDLQKSEDQRDERNMKATPLDMDGTEPKVLTSSAPDETLWDGLLQLNTSVTVAAISYFKSGELNPEINWPKLVNVKGRVKLEAFEKFIQELPRSRNRALMVVSLCWKLGTSETGLSGMQEVANGYERGERIGFAEITPGIDLYVCPRCDTVITILAKYGFYKGMPINREDNDLLLGCVVWRKGQQSLSSTRKSSEKASSSGKSLKTSKSRISSLVERKTLSDSNGIKGNPGMSPVAPSSDSSRMIPVQTAMGIETSADLVKEQNGQSEMDFIQNNMSPSMNQKQTIHGPNVQPVVKITTSCEGPDLHSLRGQGRMLVEVGCHMSHVETLKVTEANLNQGSLVEESKGNHDYDDLPEFDFVSACGSSDRSVPEVSKSRAMASDMKLLSGRLMGKIGRINANCTGSTPTMVSSSISSRKRVWEDDDDDMPEWRPTYLEQRSNGTPNPPAPAPSRLPVSKLSLSSPSRHVNIEKRLSGYAETNQLRPNVTPIQHPHKSPNFGHFQQGSRLISSAIPHRPPHDHSYADFGARGTSDHLTHHSSKPNAQPFEGRRRHN